uniref:Uncharacterized protein n=1 Tax=Cucumis melo TaxID=3656 RepID=A0A9I9EGB9_CUCME
MFKKTRSLQDKLLYSSLSTILFSSMSFELRSHNGIHVLARYVPLLTLSVLCDNDAVVSARQAPLRQRRWECWAGPTTSQKRTEKMRSIGDMVGMRRTEKKRMKKIDERRKERIEEDEVDRRCGWNEENKKKRTEKIDEVEDVVGTKRTENKRKDRRR